MVALGSWAWAEQTGGRLRRRDRMALAAQAVLARAKARWSPRRSAALRHIDFEQILPPDSAICTAAESLLDATSPPYLINHAHRAYFWARLLNGDARFDDEAVYVGLMLHDLGLTSAHARQTGYHCFTLPAARAAHRLARRHGWTDRRARLVADAICLHLNVTVSARHGREAQLVRIGSGADVAGLGLNRLDRATRDAVIDRFPRHGFKAEISQALASEVEACPCSRIAFLHNKLGFGRLIQKTPIFAE